MVKTFKKLVVEYLLPSISGGAIAKRILQAQLLLVTLLLQVKVLLMLVKAHSISPTQLLTLSDAVYAWTVTNSGGSVVPTGQAEVTAGQTASGCTVQWKAAGELRCEMCDFF